MSTADKLLDAATRAFAASGYDGASVRSICADAGVNAHAIHYHFGSKDELYRAVLERFLDEQDEINARLVTSAASSLEDLRTRLMFFLDTIMEFWLRSPGGLEVMYRESKRQGPHLNRVVQTMMKLDGALVTLLCESQNTGVVREGIDLALVAATLTERCGAQVIDEPMIKAFYGYSLREPERRRQWVHKLLDIMLFGIGAPA